MEKHCRAVLSADVGTLPVQLRRIMVLPEDSEQVTVRDFCGVISDLYGFCVAGTVRANIVVSRILGMSAGVADPGIQHPRRGAKCLFYSPETTSCKRSFFRHGILQ